MNNILLVNKVHGLTNLPHEYCTGSFSQNELFIQNSVKQLSAIDSVKFKNEINNLFDVRVFVKLTTQGLHRPFCCIRKHRRAEWFLDAGGGSSSQFLVQHFCVLFGLAPRWISPLNINSSTSLCICKLFRIFLWKAANKAKENRHWMKTVRQLYAVCDENDLISKWKQFRSRPCVRYL